MMYDAIFCINLLLFIDTSIAAVTLNLYTHTTVHNTVSPTTISDQKSIC